MKSISTLLCSATTVATVGSGLSLTQPTRKRSNTTSGSLSQTVTSKESVVNLESTTAETTWCLPVPQNGQKSWFRRLSDASTRPFSRGSIFSTNSEPLANCKNNVDLPPTEPIPNNCPPSTQTPFSESSLKCNNNQTSKPVRVRQGISKKGHIRRIYPKEVSPVQASLVLHNALSLGNQGNISSSSESLLVLGDACAILGDTQGTSLTIPHFSQKSRDSDIPVLQKGSKRSRKSLKDRSPKTSMEASENWDTHSDTAYETMNAVDLGGRRTRPKLHAQDVFNDNPSHPRHKQLEPCDSGLEDNDSNVSDWDLSSSISREDRSPVKNCGESRPYTNPGSPNSMFRESKAHFRHRSCPLDWNGRYDSIEPKESWDDDFDTPPGTMHIPRAIQSAQDTIRGHLGQVREFASLIDDIKQLQVSACHDPQSTQQEKDVLADADAIVALADMEEQRSSAVKTTEERRADITRRLIGKVQGHDVKEERLSFDVALLPGLLDYVANIKEQLGNIVTPTENHLEG